MNSEKQGGYSFCPRCRFPIYRIAGKYQLTGVLAKGGFAVVYKAEHVGLEHHRLRAVKIIEPELFKIKGMKERFAREVQVTSQLSQHNLQIVRIFDDFGEIPNLGFYYVMEYLQGHSLQNFLLEQKEALPLWLCRHIFVQLCQAMKTAHEAQIVHRDLKPANLFLIESGQDAHFLKVLDFGIAKPFPSEGTPSSPSSQLTSGLLGTPLYMSPEQCLGQQVDERSDIYSMGLILSELLTGWHPFLSPDSVSRQPSGRELIAAHLYRAPGSLQSSSAPVRDFPLGLEAFVKKTLSKRASDRFQSVAEMLEVFEQSFEIPEGVPEALVSRKAPQPHQRPVRSSVLPSPEFLIALGEAETATSLDPNSALGGVETKSSEPAPIESLAESDENDSLFLYEELEGAGVWSLRAISFVVVGVLVLFSVAAVFWWRSSRSRKVSGEIALRSPKSRMPKKALKSVPGERVGARSRRNERKESGRSTGVSGGRVILKGAVPSSERVPAPRFVAVAVRGLKDRRALQVVRREPPRRGRPRKVRALKRKRATRKRRGLLRRVRGCPSKALFWTLLRLPAGQRRKTRPQVTKGIIRVHRLGFCVGVWHQRARLRFGRSQEGYIPCALYPARLGPQVTIRLLEEGGFEPSSVEYCLEKKR